MILCNNGLINCILLQDKKYVVLLSTTHHVFEEEFILSARNIVIKDNSYDIYMKKDKINLIDDYNHNMNGVDILDQKLKYYDINRKTVRWTFKLTIGIIIYSW